jgi:hypothetical protein
LSAAIPIILFESSGDGYRCAQPILRELAEQYLIFAEGKAMRRIAMTMQDWIDKLEGFLTLNDRDILQGAGKVSAELAKFHAEQEFDKFRVLDDRHFESDFDRMVKQLADKSPP